MVLLDTSDSMKFGVYDDAVDYDFFYDYIIDGASEGAVPPGYTEAQDYIAGGSNIVDEDGNVTAAFYGVSSRKKDKIYLFFGDIGYANGQTGDAGDPEYTWYTGFETDTRTYIIDGEFYDDTGPGDGPGVKFVEGGSGYKGRLSYMTVDGEKIILFDGQELPNDRGIALHDWQENPDNSRVDKGFAGMLKAPGSYFSGHFFTLWEDAAQTTMRANWNCDDIADFDATDEALPTTDWVKSDCRDLPVTSLTSRYTSDPDLAYQDFFSERKTVYFFVKGNWFNMQTVFNLRVKVGGEWKVAWRHVSLPAEFYSPTVDYGLQSPNYPGDYPANYDSQTDPTVNYLVYNGQSAQMALHFKSLSLGSGDRIELYNQSGVLVHTITSMPDSEWTPFISGNQILVRFISDDNPETVGEGFRIDAYQYQSADPYDFFDRFQVAADALSEVVKSTRGKVNWGFTTFDATGESDGAQIDPAVLPIDPTMTPTAFEMVLDTRLAELLADDGENIKGGTPLGEALQDLSVWFTDMQEDIYENCNKNIVIVLTDGFPDRDGNTIDVSTTPPTVTDDFSQWGRIDPALNFHTDDTLHDDEQYAQDPFQYPEPAPNDYFDDVARFLYTHSWVTTETRSVYDPILPLEPLVEGAPTDEEIANELVDTPDNILVNSIGFTVDSPMLAHAAELGGGAYLTAFSKSQLVNAFYSLGLLITDYTSYTAPVVSVDEANRVQSGDKLYMALFKPNQSLPWTGNLKKYGLAPPGEGHTCPDPQPFVVVDKTGNEATDCDGVMLPTSSSFWSTGFDGGEVDLGGVGEVLNLAIPPGIGLLTDSEVTGADFRNIKTSVDGTSLVTVSTDSLTNTLLGVGPEDDAAADMNRYKIVNFLYGYTYDAEDDGSPVSKTWPMGPIVHSEPVLIDYTNPDTGELIKRYIAVGANDGMLHVFDDANGREVFAFVPPAVLNKLKSYDPAEGLPRVYTVDGPTSIVRKNDGARLLLFGLRRGGQAYYALNITSPDESLWTLAWEIAPSTDCGGGETCFSELGQSWSRPKTAIIRTGASTFKRILIFGGGYDPLEDRPDNEEYNMPDHSSMGRGIYIVDVDTGRPLDSGFFDGSAQFVWTDGDPSIDVLGQMKYCFPADPTVVSNSNGLLSAAYLADLYGQIWKVRYEYNEESGTGKFYLNLIFKLNPMYDQASAYENKDAFVDYDPDVSADPRGDIEQDPAQVTDTGVIINPRRTYYGPDVSYAGNTFTDVPVLYIGTGDREHPTFIGNMTDPAHTVRNGLFGFYDAQRYTVEVLGEPTYSDDDAFDISDLLNVTCGALEPDVNEGLDAGEVSDEEKTGIETYLKKTGVGWYILFDDQDGCPHQDIDEHAGEKAIAPVTLFAKVVFSPTFTPDEAAAADPCVYDGFARVFAVDYDNGNAAINFFTDNDVDTDDSGLIEDDEANFTRRDRYLAIGSHIPSGISILIRHGKPAGFISVGGKIAPVPGIKGPSGMIPFYWREMFE